MADQSRQRHFAESFLQWHQAPPILVLPNAWDVISARLVERAGARAIATTSAGIANVLGYADGEKLPFEALLRMTARIVDLVDIPVTVDLESGYGRSAEAVAESVRGIVNTGAVGVNLEDGLHDPRQPLRDIPEQAERIRAARAGADATGIPLVVNARTDVFLRQVGDPGQRLETAIARANAYREAGADCLFVPGVADAATIGALAKNIHGPLNVLAGVDTPKASELETLGVARVSTGPHLHQVALAQMARSTRRLLDTGDFGALETDLTYHELNQLLEKKA